ncbi:MAG: hypothetical protein ACJ79H_02520 [Myxococcales bacterium]
MTLLALLLALAQQGGQPATQDRPGVSQPSPNDVRREGSTSSNTTDKAESLSPEHHTDLQGGKVTKRSKRKRPQARTAKPMPEPSAPPSVEQRDADNTERKGGTGKPKQPKPIGEKSNQ